MAMNYEVELQAEKKILQAKIAMLELRVERYEKMFSDSCNRSNRYEAQYNIAKEALEHIAEHSFIPPASFVDVASDALYRIGQMEEVGK